MRVRRGVQKLGGAIFCTLIRDNTFFSDSLIIDKSRYSQNRAILMSPGGLPENMSFAASDDDVNRINCHVARFGLAMSCGFYSGILGHWVVMPL